MALFGFDRLGPYRLLNIVRSGQVCQILEAIRDATSERVALKVLLGEHRKNKEQLSLLQHEYAVGTTLDHPNVIRTHGHEQTPEYAYMAMEYFPYPNMKQWFQTEKNPANLERLAPRVIEQTVASVAHLHSRGWVHRDIKPDNFLINDKGDVKLIDFAIARKKAGFFGKLLGGKTAIQGTRTYMSPEHIHGTALDFRSDIYSLGCVLFELLGGRPPFTGATTNELLNKHLKATPPALEGLNPRVLTSFARLIKKTLAKDPSERPASLDEFMEEYRKHGVFDRPAKPTKTSF